MLDIVGEMRGAGNETVKSFKDAWPQAAYENYSEMDPAREWREQWDDDSKTPQVKILYDVTEAEITYLVLGRTKITDVGLKEVAKLRQLTLLDLTGTQITDAGLKEVAKLQKLTRLDLGTTKITDAGLKEVAKLENLAVLSLGYTKITDGGLKDIAKLQNLTVLKLYNTKITDAGLAQLKKALPKCRISSNPKK
jgi:Leucine-rich repeat (LRR) protein